jgi:hypothetical protein
MLSILPPSPKEETATDTSTNVYTTNMRRKPSELKSKEKQSKDGKLTGKHILRRKII